MQAKRDTRFLLLVGLALVLLDACGFKGLVAW